MLRFLCCCCSTGDNSEDEREPLLHPDPPSEVNGAKSGRKIQREPLLHPGPPSEVNGAESGRKIQREPLLHPDPPSEVNGAESARKIQREPLLHPDPPSEVNGAESARQTRPAHSDSPPVRQIGRLTMRRVAVPELDQRFSNMAESFNEQQEHYEAMVGHVKNLKQKCSGASDDNLTFTECVKEIRDEQQGTYRVSLKMKGYDFSLVVDPIRPDDENEQEPLPTMLQWAQNEIKALSDIAKAIIAKHTTLQELIEWLLSTHSRLADQVKGAAGTYQEQGRLNENLEENFKEVKRAKELSQRYKKQASDVQTEAAQIAGVGS